MVLRTYNPSASVCEKAAGERRERGRGQEGAEKSASAQCGVARGRANVAHQKGGRGVIKGSEGRGGRHAVGDSVGARRKRLATRGGLSQRKGKARAPPREERDRETHTHADRQKESRGREEDQCCCKEQAALRRQEAAAIRRAAEARRKRVGEGGEGGGVVSKAARRAARGAPPP